MIAPKGMGTRPTSDRVREALFSWLEDLTQGAVVLDIFAGSGSLGLEALSRGAARAVFIEAERAATLALRQNIDKTGFNETASVITRDALKALGDLREREEKFSLVFCDAPYHIPLTKLDDVIELVVSGLLVEGGLIVVELPKERADTDFPGSETLDTRRYGDTVVKYLKKS